MDILSLFISAELVNLTDKRIGFQFVDDGSSERRLFKPPKDVPPNKTTKLVSSSMMDAYEYDTEWEIRILMDGKFTGKKIKVAFLLWCVRIFFIKYGADQLSVLGALENGFMDLLLRVRGIGVMLGRKRRWDKRPLIEIATQDQDKKSDHKKKINNVAVATQNTTERDRKLAQISQYVYATEGVPRESLIDRLYHPGRRYY